MSAVMRPLLLLLLLAAAQAWSGAKKFIVGPALNALPRGSDWRYLPLQQTSSSKTSRTFALFAVAARLLFVPRRSSVDDWSKFLPLESSARISKALMKATLLNGAQQFVLASAPAAVVVDSAASQRSALVSSLVDWVVNLLVSLKVIQRKVQQSIQLEPIAAPAVVDTFSSAESYEAGAAWALKRLQEMAVPSVAAVTVAAVAEAEAPVAIFEAVAVEQMLPTSDLALAFDAAISVRRSYWPAAAKHLELLARSKGSDFASSTSPKESLAMRRTYWPARYW